MCLCELIAVLALTLEALTAVDRPVSAGLEGHLRGAAAAVADHFVHLTLAAGLSVAAVGAAGSAARRAAAGLVLEALAGIEFLFGSAEGEFGAALAAGQDLVLVHDGRPPHNSTQFRFSLANTLVFGWAPVDLRRIPWFRFGWVCGAV